MTSQREASDSAIGGTAVRCLEGKIMEGSF